MSQAQVGVRRAEVVDAAACARLLHAFHAEFDDDCPGEDGDAVRLARLLAVPTTVVLLADVDGALLAQLTGWARAHGVTDLEVPVDADDDGPRRLYERHGFFCEREGEQFLYYARHEAADMHGQLGQ